MKIKRGPKMFPHLKRIKPKNRKESLELAKKVRKSFEEQQEYLKT
jgi:hypothetical protein